MNNLKNIIFLFISLLFLSTSTICAQDLGWYKASTQSLSRHLNFERPSCVDSKVMAGKVYLAVDFGQEYTKGAIINDIEFEASLFLVGTSSQNHEVKFPNLKLRADQPEAKVFVDLKPFIKDGKIVIAGDEISAVGAVAQVPSGQGIRTTLHYELQYGINEAGEKATPQAINPSGADKTVTFSWQAPQMCQSSPNYEFQILRLFNETQYLPKEDPQYVIPNEREITTEIDWSQALSIETYSSQTNLTLTIGEGQGYYIWRVRPIGNYYEGEIANDQNWGKWNDSKYGDSIQYTFNQPIGNNIVDEEVFFFTDVDDAINYQYSRVFTEGNKQSEQVTYATPLNQVKQSQRYFPSKGGYKVITQNIIDNSGRPTLSTLPVPIEGSKLNGYQDQFVTTSTDNINGSSSELYRAKHFDTHQTINNPGTIDATGAFQYYNGTRQDRVADAQGYPFTRVIYSNDGTNRVIEQSGVGKTHMIGQETEGFTRTTRTYYETPTEDELVTLFGDEAPQHENISKIITIDPNNTTSVAYVTKEGKTIATGLTFSEEKRLEELEIGSGDAVIKPYQDRITNNRITETGYVASKRIVILDNNGEDLDLQYEITKAYLEGLCFNVKVDLDYDLVVTIYKVGEEGEASIPYEWTISNIMSKTQSPAVYSGENENETKGGTYEIEYLTYQEYDKTREKFRVKLLHPDGIHLEQGTYYVQKRLVPSDDITAHAETSKENMRRLIEPYFEWLTERLDMIDCKEEMNYLYNDIYYFGQQIAYKTLVTQGDPTVKFNCVECSQYPHTFKRKSNPEDVEEPDEFYDYYLGKTGNTPNKENYSVTIWYTTTSGQLEKIEGTDYAQSTLGEGKTIVRVIFDTPCCSIDVPVVFTPPFKVPSNKAIKEYRDSDYPKELHASTDYYNPLLWEEIANGRLDNHLKPNYQFLTQEQHNFSYVEDNTGKITITNGSAYPLDFEGYLISMLYECKSSGDEHYTINDAQKTIYSYMRGWHRPGLLNQMVYHMLTDNYGEIGCNNRKNGQTPSDYVPPVVTDDTTQVIQPTNNYKICDVVRTPDPLEGAQYNAVQLAKCWEGLAIQLVNEICGDGFEKGIEANEAIAKHVDDQNESALDSHIDQNIKNFIIKFISKRKLKKMIRSMRVAEDESADSADEEKSNIVNNFLQCTGYAFADIIEPVDLNDDSTLNDEYKTSYPSDLGADFDSNQAATNGGYNPKRLEHIVNKGTANEKMEGTDWSQFSLITHIQNFDEVSLARLESIKGTEEYNQFPDKYREDYYGSFDYDPEKNMGPPHTDPAVLHGAVDTDYFAGDDKGHRTMKDLFPNIKDPVYAFKYYEYSDNSFPDLELTTCYRDPNWCKDAQGRDVPCCRDSQGKPIPCNFCGIGYIECPYSKIDWNCGQRYTFFSMLKNYKEQKEEVVGVPITCENYYEQTVLYKNPCYGKFLEDGQTCDEIVFKDSFRTPSGAMPKADLFNDLEYISNALIDTYLETSSSNAIKNTNIRLDLEDINHSDPVGDIVSYVEDEARKLRERCETNCESRRAEFRQELIDMFLRRCYVIGGCKQDQYDNIVPEEDIDKLVEEIILQCASQCKITTYTCKDDSCRNIKEAITSVGQNDNITYIDYGVAGRNSISTTTGSYPLKVMTIGSNGDYQWVTKSPQTNVVEQIVNDTDQSRGKYDFIKYSYNDPDATIADIRKSLPYYEYSRWIQAMQWRLNLDIASMCNAQGVYYDPQHFPIPEQYAEGYIQDPTTGEWKSQNFVEKQLYFDKSDRDRFMEFKPVTAPTMGGGDTTMPRESYTQTSFSPVTAEDNNLKEANSPEVKVELIIDGN